MVQLLRKTCEESCLICCHVTCEDKEKKTLKKRTEKLDRFIWFNAAAKEIEQKASWEKSVFIYWSIDWLSHWLNYLFISIIYLFTCSFLMLSVFLRDSGTGRGGLSELKGTND